MLRISSHARRLLTGAVAAAVMISACGLVATSARAAQPEGTKAKKKSKQKPKAQIIGDQPIAIINVASATRMLNDVERTFKSIDKPEIFDLIKGFIGNFGDLKGMDREKPFGVMVFLNSGIPPTPAPVGYIPVKNMADLVKSLSNGPFKIKEVEGLKDRYEISGPDRSVFVGVKNGYAFVTDNVDSLDRTFPDPVKFAEPLAKRYDLSFSLNMNSIAKESRGLLATLLRAASEAEMQQRDGESESAYSARRARGMRDLEWIEAVLLDCETVLIGLDASSKSKNLVVETALDARPNSKLAKMVKAIGGKRSYFDSLLNEKSPLSVSVSWGLNKVDSDNMVQGLRLMAAGIAFGLDRTALNKKKPAADFEQPKEKKPAPRDPRKLPNLKYPVGTPIAAVIEPIIAMVEKNHFDMFLQIVGEPPEKFSMIAGLQVMDGKKMAAGLADLMRQLQGLKGRPGAPEITVNAETYKGVAFHRLRFSVAGPMRQFFGETPALLVGASSKAVWIVLGSESAFPQLRKAIDQVVERKDFGKKRPATYPLRFAVNVGSWLAMAGEDTGRPGNRGREIARKAFEKGGDAIRVELKTVENGIRARVQLDEGFIKFIGLNIANQYERSRPPTP